VFGILLFVGLLFAFSGDFLTINIITFRLLCAAYDVYNR